MRNVNEIVKRMREAIGVSSDKELGEHLHGDIKTSTISNWKTRNSIPYPYIDQLVSETGRTFEWFLSGNDTIIAEPSETYENTDIEDLTRIRKELIPHDPSSWEMIMKVARTTFDNHKCQLELKKDVKQAGQKTVVSQQGKESIERAKTT